MRNVLFYRNYRVFTGGHYKVWDYFNHVRLSATHRPQICFSKESSWDKSNPWLTMRGDVLQAWDARNADVVFMEGMDWQWLGVKGSDFDSSQPVINLIQHIRHADPANPRYAFLKYKAIRICVSPDVTSCLEADGSVNGPVFTIPLGLDVASFRTQQRDLPVLIIGNKNPTFAEELSTQLKSHGIDSHVSSAHLSRDAFLDKIGRAAICVLLPMPEGEGFYMPALEGMAQGTFVICPDCVGNRSFCLDGVNSLRPEYTIEDVVKAVLRARSLDHADLERFRGAALQTVQDHALTKERRAFLDILENVTQIW